MKLLPVIFLLGAVLAVRAQTVANTSNVLHPLTKNGGRNMPSSLDQDPSLSSEYRNNPGPRAVPHPAAAYAVPAAPLEPAVIVAKIDASLVASKISIIGTVSGIKGRLYVTNIGSAMVTPVAQFAVCNPKGYQIATTSKRGEPLAPNDSEKIEVVATNLTAVDVKLMKLSAGSATP